MRNSIIIFLLLVSCSSPIRTVGLFNGGSSETVVETFPQITYNGSYEKYIGIEHDSTSRGKIWRVADVNAIIVYPLGYYQQGDTAAKYIMRPGSGFELGSAYKKKLDSLDLKISLLKIYTTHDTIVAVGKAAIWNILNYDDKVSRDRRIRYDKGIVLK